MDILPAIDIRGGKCVRLRQGDYDRETVFGDDPVEMARKWADAGADWLHLVDLDGARDGRLVNGEVIRDIVRAVDVPCELGGGVRNDDSVARLLCEIGLERVIIGTQALKHPEWFEDVVGRYPGRVILGLDVRDGLVATEGWLDVSATPALELARAYRGLPLAAIVYTNIANDGMMQGVDDATIAEMVAVADVGTPVIASGGVTTADDVGRITAAASEHPKLVGAIIGRALYEGTLTVEQAVAVARGESPPRV